MNDLKELNKFLKLCRRHNVESIKFDGVEVFLGAAPQPQAKQKRYQAPAGINDAFDPGKITVGSPALGSGTNNSSIPDIATPDELTEEQLLFYSSAPTATNQQN